MYILVLLLFVSVVPVANRGRFQYAPLSLVSLVAIDGGQEMGIWSKSPIPKSPFAKRPMLKRALFIGNQLGLVSAYTSVESDVIYH